MVNKKKVKKTSKKTLKKTQEKKLKPTSKKKPKKKSASNALKITLIVCAVIIILILIAYFYINSLKTYTYENVDFETVHEGKLLLYQTAIIITYEGALTPYNFYLRTNPKELKKVEFDNSGFELMKNTVINFEDEFNCEGYGIIAVANLARLHEVIGLNIVKDENATCDERYLYLNVKKGEKTKIEKLDANCYNIIVEDCEILKATERIMLEIFVEYNK